MLSTAELKKQVEVADASTVHDAYLDSCCLAAQRLTERFTGRAWTLQTHVVTQDRFPSWHIKLPTPPLRAITSIVYVASAGTTTTLSTTIYQSSTAAQPGFITPSKNNVWPSVQTQTLDAVTITYTAGYSTDGSGVPEDARRAIAMIVGTMFRYRESVSEGEPAPVPMQAKWMLDGLRVGHRMVPGSFNLTNVSLLDASV